MIGTIVISVLKASAIILSGGMVYIGFWIYKVYRDRKYLSQFENVKLCDKYSLILGDEYEENEIDMHINNITDHPDVDFCVEYHFMTRWVHLYSPKSFKEFKKLFPKVIDRSNYEVKFTVELQL